MSDYTRAQILAEALDEAEGTGSSRWSTDYQKRRLDWVFAQEWRRILAANPYYRWALREVVADGDAQIAYTALDSGAGNSLERFHKVLAVAVGETPYEESDFHDHPLLVHSGTGEARLWWHEGDHLALPPADANGTVRVWVNHTPQRPSQLALDSDLVTFPRGYEGVLVYELAALLLSKGGAESDLALELKGIANGMRSAMFSEITRRSTRPTFIRPSDTPAEWGSR